MTRRNLELSLLLVALILGGAALALVALAGGRNELALATPILGVLVALYLVAHIVMRFTAREGDPLLLPLAAALNGLGLAVVYRLDPRGLGPSQITWTLVGLGLFAATLAIVRDHRNLAGYKYILGSLGIVLALLPAIPGLGKTVNGAQLWLDLGPLSFQPGEFAKVLLVIFFAAYLAERKELLSMASRRIAGLHVPDPKHFGPVLVVWGMSLAVMFYEKDLGMSFLLFAIFLVMLYIATARFVYLAGGFLLFALGAYAGYQRFTHVQTRVTVWLDVFDPRLIGDESFQMAQSLFALATGGLFGTGLGRGRPGLIPYAETDFVFSAIGEELGFLGTTAVVVCFLLIVARGFKIAMTAADDFGRMLAAGLTAIFALQTLVIMGGVTRLLPMTGITLPFMSYGGSSLLSNFVLIALLIRVSHRTAAAPPPAATGEILIGGRR